MARYQFQGIFHDGNGKVVSDGTISVYLAGTTTVASVYTASSGGTAVNSVTSDSSGVFSFWVDDSDYGITQLFKLVLSMTNFETKTYDNIFACATTSALVDLTTAQTLTNKTLTTPVIASFYQDAAKTKLMTTPNTASDTLAAIAATQTLTNKTLTTPVMASLYQDAGKTKLMTVPNTASDTLTANAATQTLTNKTLTSPTLTTPLINDGDTGLSITSANQTHAAPTATIPDIGDAADTFVMKDTTQTLTGKTLTAPTITSPVINVTSDAQGDIYFRNSSGNLARLAPGTSGYYLKTQGAAADPAWAAVSNAKIAGDIVQVVSTTKTDTFIMTSTTLADITGFAVAITPTSATNKVLITVTIQYSFNGAGGATANFQLFRDTTAICLGDAAGSRSRYSASGAANSADVMDAVSFSFLDSPSTTSATTYKVQANGSSASVLHINYSVTDTDNAAFSRTVSTITVMEVQV